MRRSALAADSIMTRTVQILIVDDRSENLLAVESVLESPELELVSVTSGTDALKQLLDRDFAVIMIDVVMPIMDGFELAAIIKERERSRHTPIIFITAGAPDIEHIYRGYSVGAVDYMTKPLDADVLRAKVGIFVDLFRKDQRILAQADALRAAERRERELEVAAVRTASEQRYRNLAEAIPHIVWTAAPDGAITYFNQRWFEYTGQEPIDAHGWNWVSLVHPDDADRCATKWLDGLATGQVFQLECRLKRRDGVFRWHLCRAVPELEGERIVAWLGTYTDLDDLRRAYDAAEQAVQARDEFLSIASHELRTPLTTLQLRMNSLHQDVAGQPAVDARIRRKLDSSLRQSKRLIGLVDNLLDVSRITSGQLTLQRESLDLAEIVHELVDRFSETAAAAGIALEFQSVGTVRGTWDRLRVEQIAENLIGNAIKYAPQAPIAVTVSSNPDTAILTVRDRGPGISPDDRERIFGPFERAVSSRNYGGLGLGLYIAYQTAIAHGGTLRALSEPGEGATFIAELPLQPP
ncbi:MAG TPA: ATP-binding protein [Kofleriaceae bacterium]